MNKKMNFLAVQPLYGAIIFLFWLFIKSIVKDINKKKFDLYFYSCGIVGGIFITLLLLLVIFLDKQFDFSSKQFSFAIVGILILGGYLMNLYTFLLFNKKWEKLKILDTKW